jgi:transcriptional regulator with XRE-family HTH domain
MVGAITVEDIGEQIGAKLKMARESAGLELEDVAFRTRIPRPVVAALEAEDFSIFASPVYARGFLAQYSEFLNVEAQPWLDALEPGDFIPGGALSAVLAAPGARIAEKPNAPDDRSGVMAVMGLLALSCALVAGAVKGYEFFERHLGGKPHHVEPQSPAVNAPPEFVSEAAEMDSIAEVEKDAPPRAIIVR